MKHLASGSEVRQHFAAPNTAAGSDGIPGQHSDVFSLRELLWELLTRRSYDDEVTKVLKRGAEFLDAIVTGLKKLWSN
jgi:hypothetical protein